MGKHRKKILLLGLANSGKSSISLSMQKITNLSSFTSLLPTTGIDISKFEDDTSKYLLWDFGGQEQYQKKRKKNLKEYISQTEEIFYVIDIQDDNLYYLSVVFLREILTMLKNIANSFELSIYFHKFDVNFTTKEEKVKELIILLEEEIPKDFTYKIYHTRIYTLFEKKLSSFVP